MDKGVTCEHLNKLADVVEKELWQSKEALTCFDCGCPGPNLWICLQQDCHHIGCSEVKNDHSTSHQRIYPSHCVHMNVSTERIWCYACEKEVHGRAAVAYAKARASPEAGAVGGSSARLGFGPGVAMNVSMGEDEDEARDPDDEDTGDRPKGLVGLQNMGNTCYMNAALQALSNTKPLTSYFLDCALPSDSKPGLSRSYQKLIREMWSKTRGCAVPSGILYGIRNVHPMFRGYHQHDTQEFLRCFMDQLHEELKEPVPEGTPSEDNMNSEDGDHNNAPTRLRHVRRRAASSGASDATLYARMRRKSPAPSAYSEPRPDGYLRVHTQSESGNNVSRGATRHRRSASFAGTHQYPLSHTDKRTYHGESLQRAELVGSESSLSCSSEADERYETCSSGASDAPEPAPSSKEPSGACGSGSGDGGGGIRYRSVISDVFDGKLLSSVQCLVCDRVSTRVETFQDLSLPIPSREHLAVLRSQQPHHMPAAGDHDSWFPQVWWLLGWLRSWFYGPVVSLQDCLAAFFSADELKGDNMYSCSRCKKLRNGVKLSGVVRLPEVLCVHLKRFRHELMFSAKVGARVAFPLEDLDMAPYNHKDCTSKVHRYQLSAVICHSGTAGGGHYTCVARNGRAWYEFDDTAVSRRDPLHVAHTEAYVLFYRKVNPQMTILRQKAAEILESATVENNDIKFFISKQWINKFNTWAEPGPIDNSDFVCAHGAVRPDRAPHVHRVAAVLPQPAWEFLYQHFGGGPACTHVHECVVCARAAESLRTRRRRELTGFCDLNHMFQEQERPRAIYAISMCWFRQWQAFVRGNARAPPPVDNSGICVTQEVDGAKTYSLKPGSDHAQLSEELWRFFTDIYGGGPEIPLKLPMAAQPAPVAPPPKPAHSQSHSDREDYCTKSTSETNIRDSVYLERLQKNQSLQNINRSYRVARKTAESDDDVNYRQFQYKKHEPNGNYQDSDEEMEVSTSAEPNTVKMENGVDSSDHDANDNPVFKKVNEKLNEIELPNLDSISLKNKPSKAGKVRKPRRRTVK